VTCRKSVTITVNPNITPVFTQVAPICNGATLAALPTTSTNNITGTWSPALINTATTTYTFTPTAGLCATTATMTITVNPNITPAFTQVAAICNGATLAALPTTSTNSITGTWSPALNNTATSTYTFTPTAGQCATTATMTITVNPNITPTFTLVAPICNGATLAALPTTSTNNITGTWSPALNNTATTTYTFTPTAGQCATTATMTITVNPNVAPVFTQVAPICNGATLAALLTTSTNNITGTWSPALNNTATTTYTFTPTAGQCATTATMTITVNPIITPAFTQVAAICSGADLSPLPTISTNGVNGTWSPALNYTATTTYTFTPISRQCATTTTMTITVNPNITPTFTQVAAICAGAPLAPLPTISNNGFTGTWSPAMNNTATTTYTFTPTAGQCATTATMTITVNPLPLPPTGTITQTFCANIYPTLQNIVVNPTNVNWFSSLTSSTPLPITTNLPVGSTTYYASQFDAVTGCSSNGRLAVLATVLLENTPSTLTDQTFCSTDLKTLADIKTNGLNIVWYSSASGGTPLLGSYVLTSSQSLYAAIYNATTGCESPIRQMVQITIINCQLVANNLLTLNDNSLNDNLKIENIENFPINQIEIYNRFGEIVWKTEYYNNDSNTFKGRANVSGVYQKDSDLPTGTYYFLLKYYDSYLGKYTDLKSFLYINNNN
jgi:serine protease inhibitor